jgi:hypothetical protein
MKRKSLLLTAVAVIGMGTASMAQMVPNYVPTNGLVGWWPFNGNANDESGNGNNGTVNGATLTADRFGNTNKAVGFDGVDDIIAINLSQNLDLNWSLNVWFNKDNLTSFINQNMVGFGLDDCCFGSPTIGLNGSGASQCPDMTQNPEKIYLFDGTSECGNTAICDPFQRNQWMHLIILKQNNTYYLYLNNILTFSANNLNINSFSDVFLGNRHLFNFQFYEGKLDDIGIWNRALTACEIADLYNAQAGSLNSSSTQNQTALDSYTWPVNGQTYTQGGTYTATLPNAAGCDSIVTLNLTLSFTGINEQTGSNIVISPNPANDYVMIRIPENLIGQTFAIVDNNGRKILSGRLSQAEQKIEIQHLSEGMYVLQIHNEIKQNFRILKK